MSQTSAASIVSLSESASEGRVSDGFQRYYERTRHQPIFIVLGVQGSGTNLLSRLLANAFGFSVMRDRSGVIKAAARLGANPTQAEIAREIRYFSKRVEPSRLPRLSKYVIRNNKPFAGFADASLPPVDSAADFARAIYSYRAYSLGAAQIAVKSDDLWEHIHHLDLAIPNRRIIMLTRDFRDNAMSISGKPFGPIEPVCASEYIKHQLAYYVREFRRSGSSAHHVTYESVLNDTKRVVEGLAAHFNLELKADVDQAIAALKLRPNKIGRWKALSAQDLAWCEGILYDELVEFGYQPTTAKPVVPSRAERMVVTCRDKIRRVPQKLTRMTARMTSKRLS